MVAHYYNLLNSVQSSYQESSPMDNGIGYMAQKLKTGFLDMDKYFWCSL